MKIAFFGGSFDPVHRGHLAVARAAADKFGLSLVYFAPADIPPHKLERKLADFQHRFAMLALATAEDKRFVPSLLDAHTGRPNYSFETVRRLKATLGRSDKLYFLIGMDAFEEIGTWRQPEQIFQECEFIVAARPGHSLVEITRALPERLRPNEEALRALAKRRANGKVSLPGATIHLLEEVHERVSSTQIRSAAGKSVRELSRLVPQSVAEYIRKEHLYTESAARTSHTGAPHGKMLSLHRNHHHQER